MTPEKRKHNDAIRLSWSKRNPEKRAEIQRNWAKRNPEQRAEITRNWNKRNPEKRRAYDAAYNKNNIEKRRAQKLAWNKRNPERMRANKIKDGTERTILVQAMKQILSEQGLTVKQFMESHNVSPPRQRKSSGTPAKLVCGKSRPADKAGKKRTAKATKRK
jgi:hypothetical protein